MDIWVYDQNTNQQHTVQIDTEPIVLGRDDACDLVLKSPFVARRHAKIVRKGNQFFVENLGHTGTRVANRDVMQDKPARVDFGDEIQIAQFSIALMRPRESDQIVESKRSRAEREQYFQSKLIDFEQEMHTALLERMNLRVTGHINKSDRAYVEQILAHLSHLLDERIERLDADVVDHTVHTFLHRLVIAEVVRQSQGKVQTDMHGSDERFQLPDFDTEIAEMVSGAVDMMPLLFDPTSVTEDLAVAEEAFEDQFEGMLAAMPSDLKRYIVRRTIAKDIQDIMLGFGPLQDLLEMANVSEIMVVGKDRIYVEKNGVIQPTTRSFFSDEVLMSVIERIITPIGRRVDHSTPLVDARLPDGSRVNVIIPPLSLAGPCLTIRKFSWIPFTIDDLIERDSLSANCAAFLRACVVGRKNIIISGGTGSGKTTLLNTLSAFARPTERIITIEESAELRLPQPHVVALESRPANIEGRGAFQIRDLVHNALRMRPDRLIVGEVRGPEALDMLQAMNTGHDGSLSTLHANAPPEAMQRLETLVLMAVEMPIRAVREQIVAAIDVVVQVSRLSSGQRRVTHITEVTEIDPDVGDIRLQDIFVLRDPEQERLRHTGYIPSFAPTMIERDLLSIDTFL